MEDGGGEASRGLSGEDSILASPLGVGEIGNGGGGFLEPPKVPIGFLNFHHVFLLEKNICLCFSKGSEKKTKEKAI